LIDRSCIRRAFARAATHFDSGDFLHREIRERLLERLLAVAAEPGLILDLGSGTGGATPGLNKRFPAAQILSLDSSPAMLAAAQPSAWKVCADADALPVSDGRVDLVFSNLMLHHCPDPAAVLTEARRVLSSRGLLMVTTFGRTSFNELGRAWATADRFTHISPFFDIQDLGNLCTSCGFTEPVLDSQELTVTYDNLARIMGDLRQAGSTNATEGRNRGLTGRGRWQRLQAAYDRFRGPDGKLPVTLEIIFCIAWAGDRPAPGDEVEIPVGDIHRLRRLARENR